MDVVPLRIAPSMADFTFISASATLHDRVFPVRKRQCETLASLNLERITRGAPPVTVTDAVWEMLNQLAEPSSPGYPVNATIQ